MTGSGIISAPLAPGADEQSRRGAAPAREPSAGQGPPPSPPAEGSDQSPIASVEEGGMGAPTGHPGTLLDLGAAAVGELEEAVGGPLYPIHGYVEPVPLGGPAGRGGALVFRCAWPGVMVYPERQPVIYRLRALGVTDVLNLCSERDDRSIVEAAGLRSHRIPIRDGDVPSDAQADAIVRLVYEVVGSPSRRLAIHCEAGVGRTGCAAALILIRIYGWSGAAALEDADRHGTLMPLQREWVLAL